MDLGLWQSVRIGAFVGVVVWLLRNIASGKIPLGRSREPESDHIPLPGMALLYIARVGLTGGAIGFEIDLDGQTIAKLRSLRYVRVVIPAGEHTVAAGPRGWMTRSRPPTAISFRADPGDVLCYTLSIARDTLIRDKILLTREQDVAAALDRIASMKRIGTSAPMPVASPPIP